MGTHINFLAVFLAAMASFVFGSVWYVTLSDRWLRALGISKNGLQDRQMGRLSPFVVTALAELLMALVLASLIGHIGPVTIRSSLITAGVCWAGFVLTSLEANHAFNGARPQLTLIDGGHWLGVLLVQGLVLGAMGA